MQRHLLVRGFHLNPSVLGEVVEAFRFALGVTSEFSVFTQVIVCATADEGRLWTIRVSPAAALVVDSVIVIPAAELFVTTLFLNALVTVAALAVAVIALSALYTCGLATGTLEVRSPVE